MPQSRVLLVHDEGLDDAVDALLDIDCSVVTAERIDTALDWLDQAEFDCVVSAEQLPDGDARTLIQRVFDDYPGVPCITYGERNPIDEGEAPAHQYRYVQQNGSMATTKLQRAVTDALASRERTDHEPATGEQTIANPGDYAPSTEQIARALKQAPVGVTITDPSLPDNPIVYVNDAYTDLTGYDRAEILGRNGRFLQGPETDPKDVATLRQAIEAEESASVEMLNYRADGSAFWNRATVAPITDEHGTVEYYVGFQQDVTARREAEERAQRRAADLHEEQRTLNQSLDRLVTLYDRITTVTMEASNRSALLSTVRETVDDIEGYRAGWIARTSHRRGTPIATIVDGTQPVGTNTDINLDTGGPIAQAYETGTVVTASTPEIDAAPIDPVEYDATTLVVVPLVYRETVHGILGVYVDRATVPDDRETDAMAAVGRIVGSGINALRTRQALRSDTVIALEFTISDPAVVLSDLAQALDSPVAYERFDQHLDDDPRLHFTAQDPPADPAAQLTDHPAVDAVPSVVDREDHAVASVVVNQLPLVETLTANGLRITQMEATPSEVDVEVTTQPATEVRRILSLLDQQFELVELCSQREEPVSSYDPGEFVATVRQQLTDRQYAALETAYNAGYFEWPRPVEGEELAESMGITRQTFHQHLRTAERKLIDQFFAPE